MPTVAPPTAPPTAAAPATPSPVRQAWRRLVMIDTTWRETRSTVPFPLLRWAAAVGVFVGLWIAGIPAHATGWICPGAIVALMILPDAGTLSFGGLKLEMLRQNRAEIEKVGDRVQQLQMQQAVAAASASGVVNNYYAAKAEAVADVIQNAEEGENAKAVPVEEVLKRFTFTAHAGTVEATPPSDNPEPESSLGS
jgi:hypothetical protein